MAIVYQHIRQDNGNVFYVGIGKTNKRAYCRINRNRHWKNIANKCDYDVEIIYKDITWELACNMEKYLIESYGRNDLNLGSLVNMTNGGDGVNGVVYSKERNEKVSNSLKNRKLKDETRLKIGNSRRGKIVVYRNNKRKYIDAYLLEDFLANGWYKNIIK